MAQDNVITIALTGQPNVGKSTVFNLLTGLNQHVGNWPGKTVERRVGQLEHDGRQIEIIDLPGTYCLTAASPEECISRDFIIHERPDVVVAILNAASLERNLYLVAELLALPAPVVIGLNMIDVAKQEGFEIRSEVLDGALGLPVVPMVAARSQGVRELLETAIEVAEHGLPEEPNRPQVRDDHRQILTELEQIIAPHVPDPYPTDWVALKLFEGDQEISEMIKKVLPPPAWQRKEALLRQHEDAIVAVASGRYAWIDYITRAALKRRQLGRIGLTQRIDNLATHPFGGLLLLAGVLALVFGITYSLGGVLQEWTSIYIVEGLATWTARVLKSGPWWLSSLMVDGVIGGVGTMLTFIPILALFFAAMGLLEDIGYMARAAYVMDRFMHAIGLHGKSFMPLFLGFGCNVPAVMGTRIIESHKGRLLTILLAPLVPCTARLAVLTVLAQVFFPEHAILVTWAMTALPLVILALSGIVAKRFFLNGEASSLIMEMPLYHMPNARTILIATWQRLMAFLKKAGTVILAVSVIIWLLATLPNGDIDSSYLATIGRFLEPLGALMGLNWRAVVAVLTSFVAMENAVATLGVLYGAGQTAGSLAKALRPEFSTASALAFLAVEMLFIPCVATVAVVKQETASWKWALIDIAFLATLTLIGGILIYNVALLLL